MRKLCQPYGSELRRLAEETDFLPRKLRFFTELSVYSSVEIGIYRSHESALGAPLPTSTRINVVYLQTLQADLRNR